MKSMVTPMKNILFFSALSSFGLLMMPLSATAQNYVPPVNYGGPNVIVNMDVLNPAPMAAPTPLTQRPAPRLRSHAEQRSGVPLRLRRPMPKTEMAAPAMAPMAEPNIVLKRPMPKQPEAIASTELAPVAPLAAPVKREDIVPSFAQKPQQPEFSAKELVDMAEETSAPVALENPREIVDITPPVIDKATETANRQRELLAKAREEVLYNDAEKATETANIAKVEKPVVATPAPITTPKAMKEDILFDNANTASLSGVEREMSEIQDIAPAAAPVMPVTTQAPAPLPPMTDLATPPSVTAPAMATQEIIEEPMEMAALAEPQPLTASPAPMPKASETMGSDSFRLLFGTNAADLNPRDASALDQIATRLKQDENAKIQLRAFADGTPETSSKARRLSLTRALTVRSYLLDQGVEATAMDVRALGVAPTDANTPADRVDIVFVR